jgi:hypothetical protein
MKVKPLRLQRSRQQKLESPNGLPIKYVGRPSVWGNPFVIGEPDRMGKGLIKAERAVELYRDWVMNKDTSELRGKNLACFCLLKDKNGNRVPCHADVLLELANL